MGIVIGNGVWRRDVPYGWEPAWILGFTNYTEQSIRGLLYIKYIFGVTGMRNWRGWVWEKCVVICAC